MKKRTKATTSKKNNWVCKGKQSRKRNEGKKPWREGNEKKTSWPTPGGVGLICHILLSRDSNFYRLIMNLSTNIGMQRGGKKMAADFLYIPDMNFQWLLCIRRRRRRSVHVFKRKDFYRITYLTYCSIRICCIIWNCAHWWSII
jgi:hypothetical protein